MSESNTNQPDTTVRPPRIFRIRQEPGRSGQPLTQRVEVVEMATKDSTVGSPEGKPSAKPPYLDSVLYHLAKEFQAVVVGRAVSNRSSNRIEVQVRPLTRRLGLVGTHSDLVRSLIQKYYPMLGSPREHSAVIFCQDHLGNSREVYVQESNFQERLDEGGIKSRDRDYYESMRYGAVGRFWKTPILFCTLDSKSSGTATKSGDSIKHLQLALTKFENEVLNESASLTNQPE